MNKECYMILAGKNTTVDGRIISGHNNDLQGQHAAQYEILPHAEHNENEEVVLPSGLRIPQPLETQKCLILKTWRGYTEGDAVAINENQVAIAGGVDLGCDRNEWAKKNDPLVPMGVSGAVRYIALQQSKTARECVEKIGKYYSTYGISYPCGVGVADKNEAWYIEAGGGHCWMAVRVPDDCYFVQGNGYRLKGIDVSDRENVILSPDLLDFVKKGKPSAYVNGKLNFAEIFGGAMFARADMKFFNNRRLWGCIRKLSPSLHFGADETNFPVFIKPDHDITSKILMDVLRDNYQGTEYYVFSEDGSILKERSICVPSCVHSAVIELRDGIPNEIGGVLWGALASPGTSPFIPYYLGSTGIYEPYTIGGPEYDEKSAFWRYRSLSNLAMFRYRDIAPIIKSKWEKLEQEIFMTMPVIENNAKQIYDNDDKLANNMLTLYSNAFATEAYVQAKKVESETQTYIAKHLHLAFSREGLEW